MEVIAVKKLVNMSSSSSSSSSSSESYSDSEEILLMDKESHKKNELYVRNVVLLYGPSDFRNHFRMSKESVEIFITELDLEKSVSCAGRPPVSALDATLLTLWCLANQESFRGIGDRFGFSKGHAHGLFIRMCQLISLRTKNYLTWPRSNDAIKNIQTFNQLRGANSFPNVFGCIDGTHIQIPGPSADNSYYNRKGYHSMLLQGICNAKQEFIDIYFGWPGSAHDARMWKNSPIHQKILDNRNEMLPNNSYLLGDSAYPLDVFLIVPFRDNGNLTRKQRLFNKKLSSTRVTIEQCFGRLKGIFRRLKYLNITNLSYSKYIVFTACIFHNFIIRRNEEIAVLEESVKDKDVFEAIDVLEADIRVDEQAIVFRNEIMNNIV